jgi:hypothetical protein
VEIMRISKPEAIFAVTGLKKTFTIESFVNLLKNSRLKIVKLNSNKKLKGYVALCTTVEK